MEEDANSRSLGIVPLPTIGLRSSGSLFATPSERDAARQGLRVLDEDATGPHGTSQQLQQTLRDLQELLKPETLTEL
jgi:cohesin loading factor subunit SCC2